jgi:hypothetical protein
MSLRRRRGLSLIESLKFALPVRREDTGGAQALERGLSAIVDAMHPGALARLRNEALDGLEEVRVEPEQSDTPA